MAQFPPVSSDLIAQLIEILGENYVVTRGESFETYTHDYTENLRFSPEVVVRPADKHQISAVMKACHAAGVPVTPAGARTGLAGGMLPVCGGVILATDRLNQILQIDERNLQVITQPAVITQHLQDAVAQKGLFYPVDPASRGSCFIGGNLAASSGGMRAVKYGITRDYVLNLEAVLADGSIIRTGANTLKNSTGYNLTQLLVGSEGTLGIITEATLKLHTLPNQRVLMLAPFPSGEKACEAVSAIFHARLLPSALEFMEAPAIDFAQDYLGEKTFDTTGIEAHLLVELDGNDADQLMSDSEKVYEVLSEMGCGEILFAQTADEQNRLWKIRRTIGEATRAKFTVKEEDTCVPRAELAKLWRKVKETAKSYDLTAFCFGHAGDGNLHVHILKPKDAAAEMDARIHAAVAEIFAYTVELGGTLSGEHGIGLVQRSYLPIAKGPVEIALMRGIKQVFDPKGILNPGKIFPD